MQKTKWQNGKTYAAVLNGKTEHAVSGSDYDALAALVNTAVSG